MRYCMMLNILHLNKHDLLIKCKKIVTYNFSKVIDYRL